MNKEGCEETAKIKREAKQLKRLEVLMDVVYAIVIWRIFQIMPRPTKKRLESLRHKGFSIC